MKISESQISYLIEDRKQLLVSLQEEIRINIKYKKKIKRYEKILGFLTAISIVLVLLILVV